MENNFLFATKKSWQILPGWFAKIEPSRFFLVAAVFFQILYTLVTPPLQAPDELNHFYRAYRISEGNFLPEQEDKRLGGLIPESIDEFIVPYKIASTSFEYKVQKQDILNSFNIKLSQQKEFKDFPNTSYYSPVSYIPQALAVYIFKKMNCSIATIYYGGRFFSFAIWLLCMFLIIRNLAVYKWLFVTLLLLPMNLYVVNSFSADTVTSILAFSFISSLINIIFSKNTITKKQIALIFIIIGLLALAKVVYVGLVLLIFLIPSVRFDTRLKKHLFTVSVLVFSFLFALYWSNVVTKYYLSFAEYNVNHRQLPSLTEGADYYAQKNLILNSGFYFLKVIYHSVFDHPQTYLKSYIGCFGTYLDIPLPTWLCCLGYLLILLVAAFENNRFVFSNTHKLVFIITTFCCFVLLLLSQHLTWDPVGKGVVDLVQGRYLAPFLPLVFMLFSNRFFRIKLSLNFIIISGVFFLNIYLAKLIYNRFMREIFYDKTEFYCDAESRDASNSLITSNNNIKLEGGIFQTTTKHKSGSHSLLLSPESPYGFSYKFKNLHPGDLIEIEGWKNGSAGSLAFSGGGQGCADFFVSSDEVLYSDSNGWGKIRYVFTITKDCTNTDIVFFAWNPSKTNVYFDDIKFSLKRLKAN